MIQTLTSSVLFIIYQYIDRYHNNDISIESIDNFTPTKIFRSLILVKTGIMFCILPGHTAISFVLIKMSRRGRPIKKRKFMWSDAATDRLVKMWVSKSDEIKGYGRNTVIHQEMAEELKDYGPNPTEIKAKLDCMKKRYR